ncbi:unnamed protein product [Thelazia callipaeda]|uniref:Tudor domain-containing protein n=1 Tax=Thelazia callipaeda TaxID=103827 RepID=A0A0N5CWG0_THECL|nr:unnamed protein product [Thelazia callipaeda]
MHCAHQNSEIFYIRRLRNKEGELLYTSDESSVDETQCVEAQCHNRKEDDDSAAEKVNFFEIVETNLLEKDLFLDIDGPVAASIPLKQYDVKYKAFFEHVKVKVGEELLVKRSDDDRDNLKWPLFFVQIQRDDLLDLLEEQLDSLEPTDSISESELQVGTLCVSYCRAFDSLFRAVITNVCDTGIEVHYIDYGNYEMVKSNDLKSINNLSDISRTHPGMAIPCILYNAQNSDTLAVDDDLVANLKKKVSCEHQSFLLRVIKEDGNGICTVEYISS